MMQKVHSSQEALAISVRDFLLNAGNGSVKRDAITTFMLVKLVQPLQKNHDEEIRKIKGDVIDLINEYNAMFDNPEMENCSPQELNYIARLIEQFGEMWQIIHEEDIIPPNLLMPKVDIGREMED